MTFIEDAVETPEDWNLGDHWLEKTRDFSQVDGPMLSVRNLCLDFVAKPALLQRNTKYFRAVDDVSFDIRQGEVFGVVGESGSGKSTIARTITGIYPPTKGSLMFAGGEINTITDQKVLNSYRRQMQMVFQDPYSSLNGRMRIEKIVAEPILFHDPDTDKATVKRIVHDLLDIVGLGSKAARKYPHEFSGGQRQRISIARALATRPRFLLCDEPTSALDVSIQAQILNLLKDLQEELGLTMLFISHDLPVIRQMCDRVGVMRGGKLVEVAETETLFTSPEHEYTKHLLALMPKF